MLRRPPRSTRTDTLFPYTTLFRSLARPNWTFASAALRLDQYVPDSIRYNDRHLLSRFQSISSAFTRLHLGKPVLLAVAAPRNKHGAQIARPTHSPRYFTRAFRAEGPLRRSEEHTSELQSLMRLSYAVFCLKKQNKHHNRREK